MGGVRPVESGPAGVGMMSSNVSPRCPKCQKTMERGHIPDTAHGQVVETAWARGAPEARRFFGGIKVNTKEQLPLARSDAPVAGTWSSYAPLD